MQDLGESRGRIWKGFASAFRGEIADADEPLRLKNAHNFAQVFITHGEQGGAFRLREFVGRSIAAALFKEGERAIIDDDVVLEEFRRGAETFREQTPEAFAADFAAGAFEAGDQPFGMLVRRTIDRRLDLQPIAHGRDLAEWDSGLGHAERARIHPEKEDALRGLSVTSEIRLVGAPRVTQRVVNVRDRRSESKFVDGVA
jgi:hypothetical protein